MKVCPMCGQGNADEAIFCEVCQSNIRDVPSETRVAEEPAEAAVYVKICRSCGTENADSEDRCQACGAFLTAVERTRKNPEIEVAPMKLTFASGADLILANRSQTLGVGYQDTSVWGEDPYASGAHLRLTWRGGKWLAEDISRNGTLRNGHPLPKGEKVALRNKDKLRAGRTVFQVEWEERRRRIQRL